MPGAGEKAYAYAKACGNIGKSFTGRRMPVLRGISRLSELNRLVFPEGSELPEKELLKGIEKKINNRAVSAIQSVLNSFRDPPEFFRLLLRAWEFEDLKNAFVALENNENQKPAFSDLGKYGTINFQAWPDIGAMLAGTEYEHLLSMRNKGVNYLQTELDRLYYNLLWTALLRLRKKDRQAAELILGEEISLRNAAWVLRLRTYYQMESEEIKTHLINIKAVIHGKRVDLASDAYSAIGYPLDHREAWLKWRRVKFLNPESYEHSTAGWHADPRYFQNRAAQYLYRMARQYMHRRPDSLDSVYCFIKIKQFEEDLLISSAEGLGMGMETPEVYSMLGLDS